MTAKPNDSVANDSDKPIYTIVFISMSAK